MLSVNSEWESGKSELQVWLENTFKTCTLKNKIERPTKFQFMHEIIAAWKEGQVY